MYQLMFNNGIDTPFVTETKLNEVDALWWADRLSELQSKFDVSIIHEVTDWLTERLPENAEVQSD